jgi:hypothetical protein
MQVQVILTGYAITTTEQGKAFLLSEKAAGLAGDGHFKIPREYHQVIVSRIPKQLWTLDGWKDTIIADIYIEAERITGIKPLIVTGVGSIVFNWLSCINEYHKLKEGNKK